MRPPWFVRGDIDGFFGLFIDNLLQLMLIAVLCRVVCGFPPELVTERVLPGAAVSILIGNLYVYGIIALSQGFLLSAMVLAAILVFIIEREFLQAAGWTAAAAALSMAGLIHASELTPLGVQNKFGVAAAPEFAIMYGLGAVLLVFFHFAARKERPFFEREECVTRRE